MFESRRNVSLASGFAAAGLLTLLIAGCATVFSRTVTMSGQERLAVFPRGAGFPLKAAVEIRWNENHIPFITAENDDDAAFALGMVHAHLRLGQLLLLRRLSQGRLAESFGPLAADIDHTLRIFNPGRAVSEIEKGLKPSSHRWLTQFAAGLNEYQTRVDATPPDARALKIDKEPFTVADLIRMGRMAGADINWALYLRFINLRTTPGWEDLLKTVIGFGQGSVPSFIGGIGDSDSQAGASRFGELIARVTRSGSNSLAIGKAKSGGAALIANDPHLGIFAPNIWLIAGVRSPGLHAVGLMIPGLPFFAIGRNPRVAWGGTNMRAINTHVFKLGPERIARLREREERIGVRLWLDRRIRIRESDLGPVISDAPVFKDVAETLAVNWTGHDVSDEVGAFLAANRAQNWGEFKRAFADYAVSAQNIVYADRDGNVGQLLAYRQPILKDPSRTLDLIKSDDNPVVTTRKSTELPNAYNPQEGFIGSANNRPVASEVPLGFVFSNDDRIDRLKTLASGRAEITMDDLKTWQRDTFSIQSRALRDALVAKLGDGLAPRSKPTQDAWKRFVAFDGFYSAAKAEPVAFESLMKSLVEALAAEKWSEPKIREILTNADYWKRSARQLIDEASLERLTLAVENGLETAAESLEAYPTWGDMHQQRFQHPLGMLPLIGSRYRIETYGADGSNETLNKAAHAFSSDRVEVSYGANARHLSDLSDPDANYFVLLGGQDGWLMSPQIKDQLPLWREGKYIQVPLMREAVETSFPVVSELRP